MLLMGALSFSSPWLLATALALPGLWWLLRLTPPPPLLFAFPAVRLLFGLTSPNQTAQSAPPWLIALRLALVTALILGSAGPAWHRAVAPRGAPLLIVVDNGWTAGKQWGQRRQLLLSLIAEAEREHQPVALLATAPPADGGAIALDGAMTASAAKAIAEALMPQPWRQDRKAALKALDSLPHGRAMRVLWLCDGFEDGDGATLAARLQTYGQLEMAMTRPEERAQFLLPPGGDQNGTILRLRRPAGGGAVHGVLRALDEQGRSLALLDVGWEEGATEAMTSASWPSELKNRVTRIVIDGEMTAGATLLLDGRWSRHAVGLADEGGSDRIPLLDDLFYGERALTGFAEVRRGSIATLLQRPLSLMILPDRGALSEEDHGQLRRWVTEGGTLLRFAGPQLAGNPDDLLPVRLRGDERLLGGALSWAQPMAVAPMPESGPFAGLPIPPDLTVSAQILAEPDLFLTEKSWAKLVDGTPLVTGAQLGKGWLVLIHTTAWPGWSNLALSGLFPEMLHRLLDRSQGIANEASDRPLPPLSQLDGLGHLVPPGAAAEAWPAGGKGVVIGPRHPPGYYGEGGLRRAVNLDPTFPALRPMALPAGALPLDLAQGEKTVDLAPYFLTLALLLLLLDLGLLTGLRRRAALMALAVGLLSAPALAADDVAAALEARLAYVLTGDGAVDEVSRAGLAGLSRQALRRTTALLAEPDGVDLERDSLSVYPLLYWPLTPAQRSLSPTAQSRLNDFMRHGGMLLIDSRDGGATPPERLRLITKGLDIPPLTIVGEQHVLAKSFYLLRDFPGRLAGAPVFAAEGGDAAHDFVSPVLIGGNDWAAAWAFDRQGVSMFPVAPGGEEQREMAFRFGINLLIYALTGSYKADQVHVPAILERMRR